MLPGGRPRPPYQADPMATAPAKHPTAVKQRTRSEHSQRGSLRVRTCAWCTCSWGGGALVLALLPELLRPPSSADGFFFSKNDRRVTDGPVPLVAVVRAPSAATATGPPAEMTGAGEGEVAGGDQNSPSSSLRPRVERSGAAAGLEELNLGRIRPDAGERGGAPRRLRA
jgi:hypothetical protein